MQSRGNRWALYVCVAALAMVTLTIEYSRSSDRPSTVRALQTTTETQNSIEAAVGTIDDTDQHDESAPNASSTAIIPNDEIPNDRIPNDQAPNDQAPNDQALSDEAPAGAIGNPEALSDPNPPTSDIVGRSRVHFVYFVEADQDVDPSAVELIEQQALALQQFWYDQFGGTFHLAAEPVTIIYGAQPAAWYDTNPYGEDPRWFRLMNIRAEVRAQLGLRPYDTSARVVTFPNARIDGKVGAHRYGGAWMDGDDIGCIVGDIATTPYTADFPANCLGTLAHEFGHVYGLGHQGLDEDCMQYGFYDYVNGSDLCDFSEENRAAVINDPANVGWLDAVPGARR